MLAENLGYGTGDAGIAKMTKDLEDGAIASNVAIDALIAGMHKYDGMMDAMANETVEGLASQLSDAYEISVKRRWGQGLQDGLKRALGTSIGLIDDAEEALNDLGDMLYEVGEKASNWVADKFQNAVDRFNEITNTFEFQDASLGEKFSMLWKGIVADPLKEWWEGGGRDKTTATAGKIGSWMGKTITSGLLAIFGVTDVFADTDFAERGGMSIAQSFANGFKENFDGSAITDAFVNAISDVWGALPGWAKILIGGYGIGKVAGGISSVAGGVASFMGGVKNVSGSFDILDYYATGAAGSGLAGVLGKVGAGLGATTTGGAILMGSAGLAGGVAGVASVGKGIYDLYGARKARLAGDETEARAKSISGNLALGGAIGGAAIGTAILPGLGTLIGAGVGGLAGWWGGNKWANSIRAEEYETEAMKEALKDSSKSAEEIAQSFEKGKWEVARKSFGDIALSMDEISRLSKQVVFGEDLAKYDAFSTAAKTAKASLESLNAAGQSTDRWMWKAGLGVTFNEDEKESIAASFDEYINSAKNYVENKHYEFSASADILLNLESDTGKSIMESGNAYYMQIQEQLNTLGTDLGNQLEKALADGFISADENVAIAAAQKKIADITKQLADAESDAELEVISLKFRGGNMDQESFDNFLLATQENLNSRLQSSDAALEAQITNLNLRFPESARDSDAYKEQLQAIVDGYNLQVESVTADVLGVELNILGKTFSGERALGTNAVKDLQSILSYSIQNDIEPTELSMDQLVTITGDTGLSAENASLISDYLQSIYDQLNLENYESLTIDASGKVNLDLKLEEGAEGKIRETVTSLSPIEETIGIDATGELNPLPVEAPTGSDFGLPSSITHTMTINVVGNTVYSGGGAKADGEGFRGGIFGSNIPAFSNGGIVRGGSQLIEVAEEGSPEMVIPLSSQRRDRGRKLWAQAGRMLDVPGFARGGTAGGSASDEGIRFQEYGRGSDSGNGQVVQVEVGGITVEINVNSANNESIVDAIKAQANDIAEVVSGVLFDAFSGQYENTPLRGGIG